MIGEQDIQGNGAAPSETLVVEDFYEDGRAHRKQRIVWWSYALLGGLQAAAGWAEGSVLVTGLAVLMVVLGLGGVAFMRRSENAARRTPLARITEEALFVRRPTSPALETVPWSRIEGIAWAGDDLGLRLRAEEDDAIGDTLPVMWAGLQKEERQRLHRAVEGRLAERPPA